MSRNRSIIEGRTCRELKQVSDKRIMGGSFSPQDRSCLIHKVEEPTDVRHQGTGLLENDVLQYTL